MRPWCCRGKCCGDFDDIHESPPGSEDGSNSEDELYLPKDHQKLKKFSESQKVGRPKVRESKLARLSNWIGGDRIASRNWIRHLSTEEVEDYSQRGNKMDAPVIRVSNIRLPDNMVKSLRNYSHVHTIELLNCGLKKFPFKMHEMDRLRCLRIARNDLPHMCESDTHGDGKHAKLQRLVLDENNMRFIDPETLSGEVMQDMVFLDLQKNKLEMLPNDFCAGAKKLEFLRLQGNQLQVIPTGIFHCKILLLLDITNNKMKALPDAVEPLGKLRKLYASSNQFTHLPNWIGECTHLEKIRISNNKLRELPHNFLLLEHYRDNPNSSGMLEELMVDGNPLVVPSITAFEMGGLQQMFRLFREHVHREKLQHEADHQGTLAKITEEGDQYGAAQQGSAAQQRASEREARRSTQAKQLVNTLALTDADQDLRRSAASENVQAAITDVNREGEIAVIPSTQLAELDRLADPTKTDGVNFFFANLDQTTINNIRSLESAVLLMKKAMHVENLKIAARRMTAEQGFQEEDMPRQYRELLNDNFTLNDYKKKVPPSELDLDFALTVYSVKPPLFSSGRQIFERFATSLPKGGQHLFRKDWERLLSNLPVKLSEEMKGQMWKMLCFHSTRGVEEERVEMDQFIAVLHAHDIDVPDPFIQRVTKVLRLQYYEGGMKHLERRIAAKNAEGEARPVIESDSSDEVEEDENDLPQSLPMLEGDHVPPHNFTSGALKSPRDAARYNPQAKKKPIISMTAAQYLVHCSVRKEDSSSSSDSDKGGGEADLLLDFESSELSEDDADDSDGSFDANDFMEELQERERMQQKFPGKNKQHIPKAGPIARSDDDLHRMMEMDPSALFARREAAFDEDADMDSTERKVSKAKGKEQKRRKNTGKPPPRDPNFNTNVYSVRQILREAYRNLPYYDFVALINFVLRGLRSIQKNFGGITYWHCHDPILTHLTGGGKTNSYPERLMQEMGFFLLDQKEGKRYWIWPERHLKERMARCVPRSVHCAGTDKMRLEDMIKLVKMTQHCLNKQGRQFTGHVKQFIKKKE